MTKTLRDASFRNCPSCGSGLTSGALTCGYCGGVIAVENVLGRLKAEIRHQISNASRHLRDRNVLIWTLALVPILILPPLLAVLMNFRSFRASEANPSSAVRNFNVFILIVAVCNIILSVIFWRWLSEISLSSGLSIGLILKSIGVSSPGASLRSI
jgi:hypothetical protein